MNRDEFIKLMNQAEFSESDLNLIDQVIEKYPWFGLPRFLKLKARKQLGHELSTEDISKAVVFANRRKHLHKWISGDNSGGTDERSLSGPELEFIDSDEMNSKEGSEELVSQTKNESDADRSIIPEKEETEMEDPETEQTGGLPVIDHLEDQLDEMEPEEQSLDASDNETGTDQEIPTEKIIKSEVKKKAKATYPTDDYLKSVESEDEGKTSTEKKEKADSLIKEFLNSEPGVIKADKETSLEGDISEGSVLEDDSIITDALAKIYVKQGLHAKAIYAYEKLSLKYPEKSAYFAAQIEKIKSISNL